MVILEDLETGAQKEFKSFVALVNKKKKIFKA